MTPLVRLAVAPAVAAAVVIAVSFGVSTMLAPAVAVDWRAGQAVFAARCAGCHATDASKTGGYGPHLAQIGDLASGRIPGLSAEEYLIQSIVDPGAYRAASANGVMPERASAGMSRQDVVSVVAYLIGLTTRPDYRRLAALIETVEVPAAVETRMVSALDAEAGRELFLGRCAGCHGLRRLPGADLRAPVLIGTGQHDVAYLVESIRDPSRVLVPGYETWTVVTRAGTSFTGRLMRDGPEGIVLVLQAGDRFGEPLTISRSDIASDDRGRPRLDRLPTSTMPAGLLSPAEVPLVVEFLRTL